MAIHDDGGIFVSQSLYPKDEAHWCWLYAKLVTDGFIKKTNSSPNLKERQRAVTHFYQYNAKNILAPEQTGDGFAQGYNRLYEDEGLKISDVSWLADKALKPEYLYLAWLCVVKSQPEISRWTTNCDHNPLVMRLTIKMFPSSDEESELLSEIKDSHSSSKVINFLYTNFGLETAPVGLDQLKYAVFDFLNYWDVNIDFKRQYLDELKSFVVSAKERKWLTFAKKNKDPILDWLWSYLRGADGRVITPYRMPGLMSDSLDGFKFERLLAEFCLWDKSDSVKEKLNKKIGDALTRKLNSTDENTNKIRKNITLSHEANEMLDNISGGKRRASECIEKLIREKFSSIY